MPCPFGYVADDAEDADAEVESVCEEDLADSEGEEAPERKVKAKSKTKAKATEEPGAFQFDHDPVSWFNKNAIKNEEEFEAKKASMQAEAKRRLEQISLAKKKLLEFDSDLDDLSMSSELSELDSDVHSLASFKDYAETWIESTDYKATAEGWVKFAAPAALAVTGFCLYQSYHVMMMCSKVSGVVLNTRWPTGSLMMAGAMVVAIGLLYLAAMMRSKRMLLASQVGLLAIYAVATALVALMHSKPTMLDDRLHDAACNRMDKREGGSRLCTMMPKIGREVAEALPPLVLSCVAVALSCLVLIGLGIWYVYELAYIEQKAAKHKRRDKRSKHSIPWDKIKVVETVSAYDSAPPPKASKKKAEGKAKKAAAGGGGTRKDKSI